MEPQHLTNGPGKPKPLLLLAIPAVLVLTVVLAAFFSAHRALNRATQVAATEGQLAFTLRNLDPFSNLAQSLGSESVAPGPSYTTGAFFDGELYLGGRSGLTVIRADGSMRLNLRAASSFPSLPSTALQPPVCVGPASRNFCLPPAERVCCCLNPTPTQVLRFTNSCLPTPRLATSQRCSPWQAGMSCLGLAIVAF
jgi:hypothetical protein